jgi:hypothetical protein
MKMTFRVLSALAGLMFLFTGINWIIDPASAAAELGMELLKGLGASTQIGDLSAFFLSLAAMIGLAQRTGQSHWFYPAAMLLGTAAVTRTLAYLTGNADFGTQFIVPEIVMTGVLLMAARTRSDESVPAEATAT